MYPLCMNMNTFMLKKPFLDFTCSVLGSSTSFLYRSMRADCYTALRGHVFISKVARVVLNLRRDGMDIYKVGLSDFLLFREIISAE